MRDRRRVQLRVIFHRGVNVSFRVEPGGFSGFLAARLDPPGDWRPAFLLTFCKSSTVKPTRSTRSQARVKEYGANGSEGCSYIPIMVLCGGKTGWLAANNKGYLLGQHDRRRLQCHRLGKALFSNALALLTERWSIGLALPVGAKVRAAGRLTASGLPAAFVHETAQPPCRMPSFLLHPSSV